MKIPFNDNGVDLAIDNTFINSGLNTSEILGFNESELESYQQIDKNEYAALKNKVKRANGSFLAMVVFTYVNIFLLSIKATVSFPFSAFVPTMLAGVAVFGLDEGDDFSLVATIIIIAIILTSIFLWLYFLSKKRLAPLWIALILFILDTVVLLFMGIEDIPLYLIDIAFHIWVISSLIGLIKAKAEWRKKIEI